MKTYFRKIQAGILTMTLVLTMISLGLPVSVSAAGGVVFEDDFEDKTGWEDLALQYPYWESSNGGGISVSGDGMPGNGNCAVIRKHTGSSLQAKLKQPLVGTVDISFDMMMNGRSVDGIYLFDANGNMNGNEWLLRVEWEPGSGTYGLFAYKLGSWNGSKIFTLRQNQWINVKMSFDVDNQKYSVWITDESGVPVNVVPEMPALPENKLYGIAFFYPDYNGAGVTEDQIGDFKLDNFKMTQLILNTGLDENFDAYTSVADLPGDWTVNESENVSIVDGALQLSAEARVENIHKPYITESLMFSGDIQYPENAGVDDALTLSAMSGESVIDVLRVQGDGQINGQRVEGVTARQNIHFDAILDNGKYTVNINGTPAAGGTFSEDISAGITGIVIQTTGSAVWSVDNLKTMPSLSAEQMEEIQNDLAAVVVEEPAPGVFLTLPTAGENGSTIAWECSPESVIDVQTGEVNYPDWELGPTDVVLTCRVTKYGMTLSKDFTYHMEPGINNLFKNGDFEQVDENGNPSGWFSTASHPLKSVEQAQHGSRAALVSGRGDSTHSGAQYISLKPNRSYRFSGYLKLADDVVEGQDGRVSVWLQGGRVNSTAGELTNYVTSYNAFYMNTNDWININSDFNTNINPPEWPATAYIYPFPVGSTTLSFYMDNFELYEYVLKNLSIRGDDSVAAPQSGEIVKTYRAEAVNQYGSKIGMENLEYEWALEEPASGVSINNKGELTVSEYAENQTLKLICKAKEGSVAGSSWIFGTKEVSVTNSAANAPKAHQLLILGEVKQGETLTAGYQYFQKDGVSEGSSRIQWYMSDSYDGNYREIVGQTSRELHIDETLAEKFIRFSVTPQTSTGITGEPVYSAVITKARKPIAADVAVKGNAVVGEKITGSYRFMDYNGDEEGATQYVWLIGNADDGSDCKVIEGATEKELIVTQEMEDKFIYFEVVPISKTAPETGRAVRSAGVIGPTEPEVQNVKIAGRAAVGNILSVEYTFYDKNNDAENNSIINWYSGDTLLQTSATYIPANTDEGRQICAEVVPISEKYPFRGTPVKSATVTVSRGGGNTVSGGGSGGGGGGFSGGSSSGGALLGETSEPVLEHITASPEPDSFRDTEGHWAEKDIAALASLGILKGKEENRFVPEDTITRAEFLACVMRSLNMPSSVYGGTFADVSENDWYADIVQTALDNGIVSQAEHFNPNAFITREEIAKIVAQTYTLMMNRQWPLEYDLSVFSDKEQISDWATGYVGGCLALGLLKGNDDGTINASANATRAQAAVIMNRLIHLIY